MAKFNSYDDFDDIDFSSFPSPSLAIIDIPEAQYTRGEFVYNFWLRDERVNEDVRASVLDAVSGQTLSDAEIKMNLRSKNLPRKIILRWKPVDLPGEYLDVDPARFTAIIRSMEKLEKSGKISIKRNIENIVMEESFSNGKMIGLSIMDNGAFRHAYHLSKSAVSILKEPLAIDEIDDSDPEIPDLFDTGAIQRAKLLKKQAKFEAQVSKKDDIIGALLGDTQAAGFAYSRGETRKGSINSASDPTKSMSLNMTLNSTVAYDVIASAARDRTKIYADEFESMLSELESVRDGNIASFDPTILTEDEFEFSIPYIKIQSQKYREYNEKQRDKETFGDTDNTGGYNRNTKINPNHKIAYVVGYIIDKREVKRDGFFKTFEPIVIENADLGRYVDAHVRYGSTYTYNIRTVVAVDFEGVLEHDDGEPQNVISTSLIASRGGKDVTVKCIEEIPPDPPVDLKFDFFPHEDMLTISWEFPINKQRDIKRFHIFRRKNIHLPFKLIAEYNFDNSLDPVRIRERIPRKLRKKRDYPVCIHNDFDFNFDAPAIYAICSVDAHGLVSNYSSQFRVKIDPVARKASKKLISRQNAPRTYPNIYLEKDTFLDTIKTSMYKDVRVYFDPEYLKVVDTNQGSLKLISMSRGRKKTPDYKINFINTDLQESETFNIIVKDNRGREQRQKQVAESYIKNKSET